VLLDDVQRPPLDLAIDPPEICPDDAHADELDASQEQDHENERGPAGSIGRLHPEQADVEESGDDGVEHSGEGQPRDREPCDREELERALGKIDEAVQGQLKELPEGVLDLAGKPGVPLALDADLAETDPTP
jgi:hypothetical protein